MKRQETVATFRRRLNEVIERSGLTRSAFATEVGMDRSTLSQLLSDANDRLPRAESIVAIAGIAQVSVDWLLGLSQEGQVVADIVTDALAIEEGAGSPVDARLLRWQAEAAGYKIRYVPSTLPDLFRNEDVIRFEYQDYGEPVEDGRIEQAEARLEYSRRPETEFEVCSSVQSIDEFALGEGIWRDLPPRIRKNQIESMIELVDELYPTVRWFLYDGLHRYSAPLTIFGPKRAAVYVGNMYLVFTATEHIRVLATHFDGLVRAAVVQPTEVIGRLKRLLNETP